MASAGVPRYVLDILGVLEAAGHRAVLVGGCVRDLLRGVRPADWDVATGAQPEQVMALFKRTVPTGLQHGTVSVLSGKRCVEVTTFRLDGDYLDSRRPERVTFVSDLSCDLSRRDFTINAMAMEAGGGLTDPFGGRADLENKIVRSVGPPEKRFGEDALRMLRALRFSAVLGFEIEAHTYAAIDQLSFLVRNVSAERVSAEVTKILLSPRPAVAASALKLGLLDAYLENSRPQLMHTGRINGVPRRLAERWCGFCALLMKSGAVSDCAAFLRSLRLDKKTIAACTSGIQTALDSPLPPDGVSWKRILRDCGLSGAHCAAAAWDCLLGGGARPALLSVLASGECWTLGMLKMSGGQLVEMGFSQGEELGLVLHRLLEHVFAFPQDNTPEILASLAAGFLPDGPRLHP